MKENIKGNSMNLVGYGVTNVAPACGWSVSFDLLPVGGWGWPFHVQF